MARIEVPPELEIVHVTPDLAAEWLEKFNKGNRRLSRTTILRYARAMANDEWKLTHQGIAFDDTGMLLDGQHRLAAVIEADVSVDFTVQRGWSRDTFAVLDDGFKRQASHYLDVADANSIVAAARILGGVLGRFGPPAAWVKVSTADTLELVEEWPELLEVMPPVRAVYRETKISAPLHAAVLAQATRTRYADRIDEWVEGLRVGTALDDSDPRLMLRRRWFREMKALNSSPGRDAGYSLIVKAWNGYATGAPMTYLRSRDLESLPAIAGATKGRAR